MPVHCVSEPLLTVAISQASFKAQYESRQGLLEVETSALRKRLESKEEELSRLEDTIEGQRASIEDLNVRVSRKTGDVSLTEPSYSAF